MRNTFHDRAVLKDDDTVYGVNLGYDFCAEHEFGIKHLAKYLGLSGVGVGIEPRKQTNEIKYNKIRFTKNKKKWVILVVSTYHYCENMSDTDRAYIINSVRLPLDDEDFSSAWDEREFAVCERANNTKVIDMLEKAINDKELFVSYGSKVFGSRFILCDARLIPEPSVKELEETDEENIRLYKAAFEDTGIKEILKAADCGYYALVPRWTDESKKTVSYFLNPMRQDKNNFGWFSLSDLKKWTKGKGPIPKKGEMEA